MWLKQDDSTFYSTEKLDVFEDKVVFFCVLIFLLLATVYWETWWLIWKYSFLLQNRETHFELF